MIYKLTRNIKLINKINYIGSIEKFESHNDDGILLKTDLGMPYLVSANNGFKHYVSISHKDKCLLYVVANTHVGCDIEKISPSKFRAVYLSSEEKKLLVCVNNKDLLFTEIWILKESILKSVGIGFTKGLNSVKITSIDDTEIEFCSNLTCFEETSLKEFLILKLQSYLICIVS